MVGETRSHIRPTQMQLKFVDESTEIGPEQNLASRLLDIGFFFSYMILSSMTNKTSFLSNLIFILFKLYIIQKFIRMIILYSSVSLFVHLCTVCA